ncbi:MAG: hypothetical protein GQ531_10000, partial [Sulfurovum sp.]|nr:hypothetical protein [Sulfurovum sp.]
MGTPSITEKIYYIDFKIPLSNEEPDISPYAQTLTCTKNEAGIYACLDQDNLGATQVYVKDESLYLHVDYVQIHPNFDPSEANKIIHHVKSKDKTFVKGIKSPCYASMETIFKVKDIKKGSKKEELLQSITMKDVIIHDLAYQGDLVIAVGSDNAADQRGEYLYFSDREGYRPGIVLKSIDGGKHWEKKQSDTFPEFSNVIILNDHSIMAFSTAGYEPLMTSLDEGKTWSSASSVEEFPYIAGEIKSITHSGTSITLTSDNNISWESKDSGKTWGELPVSQNDNTSIDTHRSTSTKRIENNPIAVLEIPEYLVNYEHSTLR